MRDRRRPAFAYLAGACVLAGPHLLSWLFVEPMGRLLETGGVFLAVTGPAVGLGLWLVGRPALRKGSVPACAASGLLSIAMSGLSAWLAFRPGASGWPVAATASLDLSLLCWAHFLANASPALRRVQESLGLVKLRELEAADLAVRIERAAPRTPGPVPAAGGEVLVASGGFRVDTERALEKMGAFLLADPEEFLLPWLRCAVACGASAIELDRTGEGLRLAFDGKPLPEAALADPYACLFEPEGPERELGAYLARGLLGAMRHAPELVRIASGSGAGRRCLRLGPGAEKDAGAPPAGERTVVEVRLQGWLRRWRAGRWLDRVQPLFPARPVELRIDGAPVPEAEVEGPKGAEERGPGFRLEARRLEGESAWERPWLKLYKHGVLVGEYDVHGGPLAPASRLRTLVNCDSFTLDVLHGHVVRDEVWSSAVGRLGLSDATVGERR